MESGYNYKIVFSAACLGMLIFGIVLISLGSLVPSMTEKFSLNTIEVGSLATLLPAGILVGSILFGPIVDRFSYKYLLIGCGLLILFGMLGIAFSNGLFLLQVSFVFIGTGGGGLNGGTNALVSDISDSNLGKTSANLSLLGVFFGIGALGMPSLMALMESVWAFEKILMVINGGIVLILLYFLIIKFPAAKTSQAIPLSDTFKMIKDSSLLVLGIFLFFQSALEGIINNWSTLFLQDKTGMDSAHALYALSIFILSLTITRIFLAIIFRKMSPFTVLLFAMPVLLIGSGLLVLNDPTTSILALVFLGMGASVGFPVILSYVSQLYTELRGTAFSFVIFISLVGNILINYIMGVLAHNFGIENFPRVVLFCSVSMLLIATIRMRKLIHKLEN